MEVEALEKMQARHRKELKDLQGRITSKKKNASKKTRKGVNDECAEMERQLREKQAAELAMLKGEEAHKQDEEEEGKEGKEGVEEEEEEEEEEPAARTLETAAAAAKLQIVDDAHNDKQQNGKKRNRQKERLARRAAEQEAATQRAEQEASSMTDHRAREGSYMRKTFQAHGLEEKDIEPDGHCLFSAVADQLCQNDVALGEEDKGEQQQQYKTVRRAAAEYMAGHADDFAPFLDEDLAVYVAKVRDTAEWGGQLELTALARRYGVEIRVIQDGRTETIGPEESKATGKTLWLAYYRHGYGLGEHYNSLRKAATTTTG